VFKPIDTDGDNLPDDWEIANYLDASDATGQNGASGDPDGDGFTNIEEYIAGTDPQDPNSLLKIISISAVNYRIEWLSVSGKAYNVFAKPDVDSPFILIATNVVATNTTTSFIDTSSNYQRRFYRVEVVK